ncbi:MAG: hypothetical protein ABIW33_05515 [Sphingomicrobium sp.]
MFVKSADSRYYPVSSVESLWTADGKDFVRIRDGATVELVRGEVDRAVIESARPILAAPDTFVLEQIDDLCRPSSHARVPVLAWIVSRERGLVPVTIEGVNHGADRVLPILMPSGEVVVAADCTYADEDSFLDALRSKAP